MKIEQCSLFSGIGAFEKAMENLEIDFKITSYCEINKYSSCAYAAIHGISEDLNLGDISQVKSEDIPYFNLLTWGFPCQDISIAGKQAGIKVGTRSGLYYEGYRILKDRLPKYSIIENVKNLTQKGHKEEFAMILEDLEGLGYKNYWKVLNAKDFGVPQNRERVFIVSILGDGDFEFPEGFDSGIRLKDILEEDIDEKYYVSEKVLKGFVEKTPNFGYINQDTQSSKVISENGLSQSLCAGTHGYCNGYIKNEPVRVGGLFDTEKGKHQAGEIWDKEGVAPTLTTMQGGYRQPSIICAVRGRYEEDGSIKQHLEPQKNGTTNTITTVQKDNYVLEPKEKMGRMGRQAVETYNDHRNELEVGDTLNPFNKNISKSQLSPTITTRPEGFKTAIITVCNESNIEPNEIKREPPLEREGWHRNAKEVLNAEGISRTISTQSNNLCTKIKDPINFRIRKLTPLECWRLMGFTDEDFNKAKAALLIKFYKGRDRADSQLYKMAGNSIVVTVIEAIGKVLFKDHMISQEESSKEIEANSNIFHW